MSTHHLDNPILIGHLPKKPDGEIEPVELTHDQRRGHLYAIGRSGSGKSTLALNATAQDIQNGQGVTFIDPHGEIAEQLTHFIPPARVADLIYLDPADRERAISLNLVADQPPEERDRVVAAIMHALRVAWADSWGANMDYILANVLTTLIEYPNTTLLHVSRLLPEPLYRNDVVDFIATKDPMLFHFWIKEYPLLKRDTSIGAILNKVGQLKLSTTMRNLFCSQAPTLDFLAILDERKILIANLAHGRIGISNARLLGSLLVSRIFSAALSRIETPGEAQRPRHYLYIDEFQLFIDAGTGSGKSDASRLLSEAAKFGLSLALFHQFIDQITDYEVRSSLFANVENVFSFRVGARDAERLAEEFAKGSHLTALEFLRIERHSAMFNRGKMGTIVETYPEPQCNWHGEGEALREQSRQRYATATAGTAAYIKAELAPASLAEMSSPLPLAPLPPGVAARIGKSRNVERQPC